jgi:NTE family protein
MRVGLTLSGGAARGISHLGVLKALDDLGVKLSIISGVSSGAIAGAFYCAGHSPDAILQLITETNIFRLMRPAFSRFGLMNLEEVEKIYHRFLGDNITFEDLKIPLIISAADINQGVTVYFSKGDLIKPLIASSSIPILYKPIAFGNHLLIDGGLLNNLPMECIMDESDYRIGSHCNPINHHAKVTTFRSIVERTFHLAINNNVRTRYKYCDLLIEPPKLKEMPLLNYNRATEIFDIGYEYTMSFAEKLTGLNDA